MSLVKCWYHYFLDRQASNNFAAYLFLSYIGSLLATSWFQAGCHPPGYGDKYREVNWTKNILMLKSNPATTQIPIILKWGGQFTASDRESFSASGVNVFIQAEPGNMNSLIEKIQHTLSANNSSQSTRINLENKVSHYQPLKIQKKLILDFIELKVLQLIMLTGRSIYLIFKFLERFDPLGNNANN